MKTEELLPSKGKKASLAIKNRWGEGSIIRAGTVIGALTVGGLTCQKRYPLN